MTGFWLSEKGAWQVVLIEPSRDATENGTRLRQSLPAADAATLTDADRGSAAGLLESIKKLLAEEASETAALWEAHAFQLLQDNTTVA